MITANDRSAKRLNDELQLASPQEFHEPAALSNSVFAESINTIPARRALEVSRIKDTLYQIQPGFLETLPISLHGQPFDAPQNLTIAPSSTVWVRCVIRWERKLLPWQEHPLNINVILDHALHYKTGRYLVLSADIVCLPTDSPPAADEQQPGLPPDQSFEFANYGPPYPEVSVVHVPICALDNDGALPVSSIRLGGQLQVCFGYTVYLN